MFGQLFAFAAFHCQRCKVEKKALTARNGICKLRRLRCDMLTILVCVVCVCVWVCVYVRTVGEWGGRGGVGIYMCVCVCVCEDGGGVKRERQRGKGGGGEDLHVCAHTCACMHTCLYMAVCVCVWGGGGGGGLQWWRWENDTHNPTMNIFVHHIFCHTFTHLSLWVLKTWSQSAQKPKAYTPTPQSKCLPRQF